jgi:hypothetical protein
LTDHYQCDLYFVPKTRAYRISGSTELFLQHCQVPKLTPHQHLRALTKELANVTTSAGTTAKGIALIKVPQTKIKCNSNTADRIKGEGGRTKSERGRTKGGRRHTPHHHTLYHQRATYHASTQSYLQTCTEIDIQNSQKSDKEQHTGRTAANQQSASDPKHGCTT